MNIVTKSLILFVAVLQFAFLVLEMFLWSRPVGQRTFAMTPEFASQSALLAANQGLNNGFLATGLVWGVWKNRRDVLVFFLTCVVVAGIFGGVTAKTSILFTQALPGLIALILVWMTHGKASS